LNRSHVSSGIERRNKIATQYYMNETGLNIEKLSTKSNRYVEKSVDNLINDFTLFLRIFINFNLCQALFLHRRLFFLLILRKKPANAGLKLK